MTKATLAFSWGVGAHLLTVSEGSGKQTWAALELYILIHGQQAEGEPLSPVWAL